MYVYVIVITKCTTERTLYNVKKVFKDKNKYILFQVYRPIDRTCKTVIKYSGTIHKKYIYIKYGNQLSLYK